MAEKPESPPAQADAPRDLGDYPSAFHPQKHRLISATEVPLLEQINRENARVVAATAPSIVRITVMSPVDPHTQMFGGLPFKIPGLPHGIRAIEPSFGSGVIITRDGYVVTNYHVVQDAQSVEVQTHDDHAYPAKIVASDEAVDIAVLKVAANDLPALPWGDSDKVEVGEQVFAIGNPFNLDDSVSKGIVSAKGRNLPDSMNYEDYIQTDAAINVGNSGGALVNIQGELIGINAAIASFTRGNEGVGFSIPSNLVRYAVEGLLKNGRIVRGYLGVQLPAKIDGGVVEQLGIDVNRGALLAGVQRNSPAEAARLRPVDFITEVDGHKISGVAQLRLIVAQIPIGKNVPVSYVRAGETRKTMARIAEMPKANASAEPQSPLDLVADQPKTTTEKPAPRIFDQALAGVQVADLTDQTRQKFGVDDAVTSGVVVTAVAEGSPADLKGVLRGDVIEVACALRGSIQELASASDFTGLTKKLKTDQGVVLLVHHGRTSGPEDKSSSFVYLTREAK